jgi:hypothetical protein
MHPSPPSPSSTRVHSIIAYYRHSLRLVESVTTPILKVLSELHDLGAAHAIFNISCVVACRQRLVEEGVHLQLMEFLTGAAVSSALKGDAAAINAVKGVYLQTLVQIVSLKQCVVDLLKVSIP